MCCLREIEVKRFYISYFIAVVNGVMAKEHTLDGARLEVKHHNPVLGKPASLPDVLELNKQIQVECQVMQFVFDRHNTDFARLQDKHGVKVRWEDGSNNITVHNLGTETSEDEFEDACKEIESFVAAFQTYTMHVTPEAWRAVVEHLKQNKSSLKDSMNVEYLDEKCKILLAGKRKDVDELRDQLSDLEIKVRKQLALEASKITITVQDVPRQRLEFLSDFDFHKKLEVKYENTNVDIFVDKCEVHIRGPSLAVEKVRADVWQAISSVKIVTLRMSQNAIEVLKGRTCQTFMKERFKASNLQALVTFDVEEGETSPNTAAVMGMTSEVAQKASCLVKAMIVEESLVLEDGQVQLEKSEKWRMFRDELSENSILSIMFDRSSNKLQLAGKREDVSIALKSVRRFLNENAIISKVLELPKGCRRFLAKHREQKLRQIQEELNKNSTVFKGIAECDEDGVIVTGPSDGVERGMKMIQDLASTVEQKKIPVNKPGMRKNLNRMKGKKMLALLESENKCVIEYFDSEKKPKTSFGSAAKKSQPNEPPGEDDRFYIIPEELDLFKPEIKIGSVTVQVETGDLTKEVTDAIGTLSNTELDVANRGGVGKAIISVGGKEIQAECSSLGTQPPGSVAVTGAGKLKARKIYHMVPEVMTMFSIKGCLLKCLKTADVQGMTSISFPANGTGNAQVDIKEAAKEMLNAIAKFAQGQPNSLHLIRIVVYQGHMFHDFRSAMQSCVSSAEGGQGILSRIADLFGFGKSGSPVSAKRGGQEVGSYFEIFAETKQDIKRAEDDIQKDLADNYATKVIEHDAISHISEEQTSKIHNLEVKHDVIIKIEDYIGRISVRGDAEDVLDVATTILEILNEYIEEEHSRGIEELLCKTTQWYYQEDYEEDWQPYAPRVNFQIETAHKDGQKSVLLIIDGARCEIVFKDMKETCLEDGEERNLKRKEFGKGILVHLITSRTEELRIEFNDSDFKLFEQNFNK